MFASRDVISIKPSSLGSQEGFIPQNRSESASPKKDEAGKGWFDRQGAGFTGGKERALAFAEFLGEAPQRERDLLDSTRNTFANVLAQEFMALQEADSKGETLLPWQKKLLDAGVHYLNDHHASFDWGAADEKARYKTFFTTFDKLLSSANQDEKLQWETAAHLATKHQIMVLQLATGAEIHVTREADHINAVPDIQQLSAIVAAETGMSLIEAQQKIQQIESKMGFRANMARGFRKWIMRDPVAIQRSQTDADFKRLMKRYEKESGKRFFTTFEVDIPDGAVLNSFTNDPVGNEYLHRLGSLQNTEFGSTMSERAKNTLRGVLSNLTKARQDAVYVHSGEQITAEDQFNLIQQINTVNGSVLQAPNARLPDYRSSVDGVGALKIGLGSPDVLNRELDRVMSVITKTVSREELSKDLEKSAKNMVAAQITVLEEKLGKHELAPADKQANEALKKQKDGHQEAYDDVESLQQLSEEEATQAKALADKEAELTQVTAAQRAFETAENDKQTKESELGKLDTQKSDKEKEIGLIETQITQTNTQIDQLNAANKALRVQKTGKQTSLAQATAKKAQLKGAQANFQPTDKEYKEFRRQIKKQEDIETQLQQEVNDIDAQLNANSQDIVDFQASINGQAQTSFTSRITALRNDIATLETNIKTKKTEIETAKQTSDGHKEIIDEAATDLQALADMKAALAKARRQKNAKQDAILQKHAGNLKIVVPNSNPPSLAQNDLSLIIADLKSDLDSVKTQMAQYELNLEIQKLADQHQMDVLRNYDSEILSATKYHEIMKRAREPVGNLDRPARGEHDTLHELNSGLRAHPDVPRPYLRLIQILGGKSALDANGKETYKKLTSVVNYDVFMNVMLKDPGRRNMIEQAYGQPLPTDIDGMRQMLMLGPVQDTMMRCVRQDFVMEVLIELKVRAESKSLGALTDAEKQDLSAIAQREALVKEQNLDAERAPIKEEIRKSSFDAAVAYDGMKKEMVENIATFCDQNGFHRLDAPVIVEIVEEIFKEQKNPNRALTGGSAEIDALFAQKLQDRQIALPAGLTGDTLVMFINDIHVKALSKSDVEELLIPNRRGTLINLLTQLGRTHNDIPALRNEVLKFLKEQSLTHNATWQELEKEIQGNQGNIIKLHEILARRINLLFTQNLNLTQAQILEIVQNAGYISESSTQRVQAVDSIMSRLLQEAGNERDALWLRGAMELIPVSEFPQLLHEIDRVYKAVRGPVDMQKLIDALPPYFSQLISLRINAVKNKTRYELVQMGRGQLDIDDEDQVSIADVMSTIPTTIQHEKEGQGAARANVINYNQKNASLLQHELELAGFNLDVRYYKKLFWDKSGRDLISAIESHLGGAQFRDFAIKMAREIESELTH